MENTLKIIISLLLIALIGLFICGYTMIYTQSKCLSLGYPRSDVDYILTRYCIKRVDQTDVVVPLSKLLKGDR